MAVTFKTKACADITLLDANARQVLEIIGKEFGVRGVITAAEAPLAIGRLRDAIRAQGAERAPDEDDEPEAARAFVPLRTRAAPFIEMLAAAAAAGEPILWGV
ncbi:MAG: DUF1840 domain-containing protein [Burkholderiales bacterium]|nr:DUF1840 domain-containing protein [Burkholderiales bacterium]